MPIYALVDVNNFYASAERLFRPDLARRPVVVLSNNDGCIVARSAEVKALGVPMGEPYFRVRDTLQSAGTAVFSSNYALYADLSARVMRTLEELAPAVEVYSIDEAFLDLTGLDALSDPLEFGRQVQARVLSDVGLPVSVGIGPTKTLAKLANYIAKQDPQHNGVACLREPDRRTKALKNIPVKEVWGVGGRFAERLEALGVRSAADLALLRDSRIRQLFPVTLARTAEELRGRACHDLDSEPAPQQQIICSRTFGAPIREYSAMREAVADYAVRAAERLRGTGQYAGALTVFLRTNPHLAAEPQHTPSASSRLPVPTADTRDLLTAALHIAEQLWQPGYAYIKAGIMLAELQSPAASADLFTDHSARARSEQLMHTVDAINRRHGQSAVTFGVQRRGPAGWRMRRKNLSPAYTTRWSDLPVVR
ncbi:error-prone [Halorhodospira halochloris]|uniref:Error-prone n=1 Tax=Halorhodospira halochloris TaxID=1052 RepID=A0A0X8XAH3_HALHR|nr:translesion error-prone DNA polymerase V subunit UmuC [Halorhodospira halochloris]MBK1652533.1 DNA polymerase V subunit UmuC [Halorhodospira halochloris]BAU57858.1 error-prone [Halorhodospira halochloris]